MYRPKRLTFLIFHSALPLAPSTDPGDTLLDVIGFEIDKRDELIEWIILGIALWRMGKRTLKALGRATSTVAGRRVTTTGGNHRTGAAVANEEHVKRLKK